MVCIVECIWHYQQTPTGIASKFGHSSIDICGAANFYPDQLHGILTGQRFQGTKILEEPSPDCGSIQPASRKARPLGAVAATYRLS